jgi:hypothetical protein
MDRLSLGPPLVLLAGSLLLAACGEESAVRALGAGDLDAGQQRQVSRAEAARDALFERLSGRLAQAVASGGPPSAITVCKDEAPRIAADVGREQGVRIGRTSHRLRNPSNEPPAWARDLVARHVETPRFVARADGSLGVLLPIRLQKRCLACHGDPAAMPAGVREALASSYPADAATGFAEGELRGWFWVEVPGE